MNSPQFSLQIDEEMLQNLFRWLQGDADASREGLVLFHQPSLSSEQAFSIIYYLQEELHLMPNHYDLCRVCHHLYDSQVGGLLVPFEHGFCERHIPTEQAAPEV